MSQVGELPVFLDQPARVLNSLLVRIEVARDHKAAATIHSLADLVGRHFWSWAGRYLISLPEQSRRRAWGEWKRNRLTIADLHPAVEVENQVRIRRHP